MPTLFTKIIEGDLPGRFVYRDDQCVAFLSIAPLNHGHTLVVPIEEVDHWVDLDLELAKHLMEVAQRVARAQQRIWEPERIGLIIAGMEVPHAHIHVVPIWSEADLHFANAEQNPSPSAMDDAQQKLVEALS